MIKVINTLSGQVVTVSERIFNHPVLGQNLVAVEDEQKSYVSGMYEPKSVDDFAESKPKRSKKTDKTEEASDEPVADNFDETEVSND